MRTAALQMWLLGAVLAALVLYGALTLVTILGEPPDQPLGPAVVVTGGADPPDPAPEPSSSIPSPPPTAAPAAPGPPSATAPAVPPPVPAQPAPAPPPGPAVVPAPPPIIDQDDLDDDDDDGQDDGDDD
ncbi:hypothetical protein GM708_15475 [Vibrio cholerae]|nr:hypothetical protein [Vibrio cholerae]